MLALPWEVPIIRPCAGLPLGNGSIPEIPVTKDQLPEDAVPPRRALSRRTLWIFRLILVAMILGLLELAGYVLMEVMLPSRYRVAREILLGTSETEAMKSQKVVGHPYLTYIATPGYLSSEGELQHNQDGYRGRLVPLDRTPKTLRILCLGGSTTYGSGVAQADQTYPAHLERLLANDLPPGWEGVEVLNGGVPHGTSAEMLTHYHFKYRYYRPDVAILNTGGNDAEALAYPHYSPDYSHWRQNLQTLRPLPAHSRWIVRSRIGAMFVLALFYSDQVSGGHLLRTTGKPPTAHWYRRSDGGREQKIGDADLAFRANVEALVRMLRQDGVKVLLVPFRPSPVRGGEYREFLLAQMARNEAILRELADKYDTGFAPFPAEAISRENWVDPCHLNGPGCLEKARHIVPFVREIAAR